MAMTELTTALIERLRVEYEVSDAELDVIAIALKGQPTAAIAKTLSISEVAVRKRLGEVYKKFKIEGNGPGKLATLRRLLTAEKSTNYPLRDWGSAIDEALEFHGREAELYKLKRWILEDHCRVILLLGMGGIGKTSLALKLANDIKDEFDCVIWRTLQAGQPLINLLEDLLNTAAVQPGAPLPNTLEDRLALLVEMMRQQRCLIVLDNLDTMLQADVPTGQFQTQYLDYVQLLEWIGVGRMGEAAHKSCLLLTSREKPKEITKQEGETSPIRSLPLKGLTEAECSALLSAKGLNGSLEDQRQLITRYIGNPLALKIVSTTIHELFEGNISKFLEQSWISFGSIRNLLDEQFNRLPQLEKLIMYWLAINLGEEMSVKELQYDLYPPISSPTTLVDALESLAQRSLIDKKLGLFSIHPVVQDYIIQRFVEGAYREIIHYIERSSSSEGADLSSYFASFETLASSNPITETGLLRTHTLLKAQAKDHVRDSQSRFILNPLKERLSYALGNETVIANYLKQILDLFRNKPPIFTGYSVGNILNLLHELQIDLSGWDFSHLTIWQAYLRGRNLHNINFAHSNLAKSVFTETFGSILSVAFSPDGKLLATGDTKREIRLWQTAENEQLATLHGHTGWVRSVAFSADGKQLVSGSEDHTIRLWDIASRECVKVLQGQDSIVRSVAFRPDGQMIASSGDKTLCLWDVNTGSCHRLPVLEGTIRSVAFSPDGQTLVSCNSDKTIVLWNVAKKEPINVLDGHTRQVRSVAFSPDGCLIASCSSDRTIRLWNAKTGACLRTLEGHGDRVWSVAFSLDGQFLASGSDDRTVRLWRVSDGKPLQILDEHTSRVWSVAFTSFESNNGQTIQALASGSDDQTIRLWDVRDVDAKIQCIQTLQGCTQSIRSVAFAPHLKGKDQVLACGSDDQLVHLWNTTTGQPIYSLSGHAGRVWAIAFQPGGNLLASGSDDQTIRLWQVDNGCSVGSLSGHSNWIRAIAFSPDGKQLASGSDDYTVRLWDVNTRQCIEVLRGHRDWVWSVAFSPDGKLLASGSSDNKIRLWDLNTRQCLQVLSEHENWVRSVVFNATGNLLASSSGDRTVKLWDVQTGICVRTLKEHYGRVRSLAFNPEGTLLACGSEDTSIGIWDIATGERVKILNGHTGWVRAVAFSPDGRELASGSRDETIRLWDVKTETCRQILRAARPYEGMNIAGVLGLTEGQKANLRTLGAVESTLL